MSDLVIKNGDMVVVGEVLAHVDEKAMDYVSMSKAQNTVRSYQSDWNHFKTWCESFGLECLPTSPKTVARYLTAHAEVVKTSTLQRRISSINQAQKQAGFKAISTRDEPLHSVWEGIRRAKGTAQKGKAPIFTEDIRRMIATLSCDRLTGTRDRAILLLGFAGAFRRSEITGLDVDDLTFSRDGVVVYLRKSKTDQEGQGADVAIPYGSNAETCPVRAVQDWLQASGLTSGALFRPINRHGQILGERTDKRGIFHSERLDDKMVARIVKDTARAAGLDDSLYSGHSLRAGFITSAAKAGVRYDLIKKQSRHAKGSAVFEGYIRTGTSFTENAAASVGL